MESRSYFSNSKYLGTEAEAAIFVAVAQPALLHALAPRHAFQHQRTHEPLLRLPTMEDYSSSMFYEIFIRRAHGCDRNQKGASLDYFRNLQNTESGQLKLKGLGSADKQLTAVKGYLAKAIAAFIKPRRGRKLTTMETQQLEDLLVAMTQSSGATALLPLIRQGLDITQPYKEA